ncbi:hypothetical protein [Massilistercora timonensis]|uniref:hypothetical protein n=1 Tax=Massilistercora timonensis TaxID=2086584 RepID=UPI003AB27987
MWIARKRFEELEERVGKLEKARGDMLGFAEEIQEYNKKIEEELNILPLKIVKMLAENGLDE